MTTCNLRQHEDGKWYCTNCDGLPLKEGTYKRVCKANPRTKQHNTTGPGTELKTLLRRFGLTSSADCKCKNRAQMMNDLGPEWCLENIETVTDWMEEAAAKKGLPFLRTAARVLMRRAVKNARRRAKYLERIEPRSET